MALDRAASSDEPLPVAGERWCLGPLLGRGGFASVYSATACTTGRRAAIKVIDLAAQSAWAQAKLRTEGENLQRAQRHQNIIELYGEARLGQYHVFVMESWGRDLLEPVLEQRGLGEAYSQGVMVQVMRALAWLHEKRICHGCVQHPRPPWRAARQQAHAAHAPCPLRPRIRYPRKCLSD